MTELAPADLPAQLQLELATPPLARAGRAANRAATVRLVDDYRAGLADETRRRQDADLALFARFLADAGAPVGDLLDPTSWSGVTWGLVRAFQVWQLDQGYAIGSINVRVATVKSYAKLAARAGALAAEEYALIKMVAGIRERQGRRLDKEREQTRVGHKKAQPTSITPAHIQQIVALADLRDQLLLAILGDHGLRVSEAALLEASMFDLERGVLRFYRPKVDRSQIHRLSVATLAAAEAYLPSAPAGRLFGGDRAIRARIAAYGERVGVAALSPHDFRHGWATAATRAGTPLKALQDAGGWASPAMPLRYAESEAIANEGVKLR